MQDMKRQQLTRINNREKIFVGEYKHCKTRIYGIKLAMKEACCDCNRDNVVTAVCARCNAKTPDGV